MAQSGKGRIEFFEDFGGAELPLASAVSADKIGPFRIIGDGITDADSGIVILETGALNGVARFTTTDEDQHSCGVCTSICLNAGAMGTLVLETRVRFADEDTKCFFMGLTDQNADSLVFETAVMTASASQVSYVSSNVVGFYWNSEFADADDWHAVYKGGTTAAKVSSPSLDLDEDSVSNAFQILRLEVDPNGTARWYVDGKIKKTVEGAASTTTDMCALCIVENKNNSSTTEDVDVDYFLVRANRDWTV